MKRRFAILIALIMMFTVFSGCSKGDGGSSAQNGDTSAGGNGGEKLYVGLSIRGLENPYYVQIKQGVEMFLDATFPDGNYEFQVMECQGSDEKQINDVKAFLARAGEDGILYVDPNNSPVAAVIAELCEEAEVYWSTCWSYADGVYPMDYKYYVMHQTADNETGGYEAAKAMFTQLGDGPQKVAAILGPLTNDASIDREKGLRKALAEFPNVELVDIQSSNGSDQESLNLTQTWLSKYRDDLNGIWSWCDVNALAAVEGLRAEGMNGKILVSGFDCIDDTLPAIDAGDICATFSSNPYLQSGYGFAYCYEAYIGNLDTESMPPEKRMIQTMGITVTKDNIDEYREEYVENKPVYDYTDLDFCISRSIDLDNLH